MKYLGSKNKIAKYLLPIMLENREDRPWVEPFVGGANMIEKVDGIRIGNDNHKHLIALLTAVRDGWIPPVNVSRIMYHSVKSNPDEWSDKLIGFIGFLCSFAGKWWGGYIEDKRNYAEEASKHLTKQSEKLKSITFLCMDYRDLPIPTNSLIYCDPPYEGTTGYKNKFNHASFWDWCRDKQKEGHQVFVSENHGPTDFKCLIEIQHKVTVGKNSPRPTVEKLFRYNI